MKKSHINLKNKHLGEDIYVAGSGPSLNFLNSDFFTNKIVIGANRVCKYINCSYVVSKDLRGFKELKKHLKGATPIISRYESGGFHLGENNPDFDCYIFDHPPFGPNGLNPRLEFVGGDGIVISYSTITSAMHLAAYMGAKNIILVGHDCGTIDGELTVKDYYEAVKPDQGSLEGYKAWLTQSIEQHSIDLKKRLIEVYNCNIVSINPFINFGLEGHLYKK